MHHIKLITEAIFTNTVPQNSEIYSISLHPPVQPPPKKNSYPDFASLFFMVPL